MNKKLKILTFISLFIIALLVLAACRPASTPAPESPAQPAPVSEPQAEPVVEAPAPKQSFYFVYVPKLIHPWYDDVKKGAEQAIAELKMLGIDVKYDWDAPSDADVVMQTQRLEAAIAKNPDLLFVSCLDVAANKPLIEDAVSKGIAVVSFDTPCPGTPVTSFVGRYDYALDGADLAEVLAEAINYEGEIGILLGSPGAENHKQRVQGFKDTIAKYPNIKIVSEEYDNDDVERAANLTASMLQAHPNLKGVFGCNASNPIGAGRAVVEAGKKGEVIVVGMDDMPDMVQFVRDGTALAMSVQNVPEIGYWTIHYALAYKNGRPIPTIHDTGSSVIFKEQVDTYK
jgi:ribose transport system substrate-binding protein